MKKFLKLLALITVFIIGTGTLVSATEKQNQVELTKQNFPDAYLRKYLSEIIDDNKDGVLQQEEINKVGTLKLDMSGEHTGYNDMNGQNNINCKGISYFKNIKELMLVGGDGKAKIYNIKEIEGLTKLTSLHLEGNANKCKLNLSKLKRLNSFKIIGFHKLNKLVLKKNIKDLEFFDLKGNATLNLANQKYLQDVELQYVDLKKIKFGNNKGIFSINIYYDGVRKLKKMKSIDVSGLKNLEELSLSDFKNLKKIKLGKNKDLTEIYINNCKKVKRLNVKKCKYIQRLCVDKQIKVIKKKSQKIDIERYK